MAQEQLKKQQWLRRIVLHHDECQTTLIGYAVATKSGTQLVTSYRQLKDIEIDAAGVVTDGAAAECEKELLLNLEKESKLYSRMSDTLERNKKFSRINSKLICYAAAGILQKIEAEEGTVYYNEAMKVITENQRKTYLVQLPVQLFHRKGQELLFAINDTSSETSIPVRGVLLQLTIKCLQRTVSGMKQKKSEITVDSVVKRLFQFDI